MLFGSHTKKIITAAIVISIVSLPVFVRAQRTEVAEADLVQAKDSFNEVWHAAAETRRKRATLQENLAAFDEKVSLAKRDVEIASKQRTTIQKSIDEKQNLIATIRGQLDAVMELRGFYQSIADTHRDSFVRFVRYVFSKNLAVSESGPVAFGFLIHHFSRPSLGESIDNALALRALLKARQQLAAHVDVLVTESKKTEEKLQSVATTLDAELDDLQNHQRTLVQTLNEKSAFIDTSWKQKQLTEAELKEVAAEAEETNARVSEIQSSLIAINEQLKRKKLDSLQEAMKKLALEQRELESKRLAFARKDEAMNLLEDAALKAYQSALKAKNTDTKLYKRLEARSLLLKNAESILEKGVIDREDIIGETRPITDAERSNLLSSVDSYRQEIALMKEGIPEKEAVDYIDAKRRAAQATEERVALQKQSNALGPKLAEVQSAMSTLAQNIDQVEREFTLGDMPPLFTWPVRGPITAGYFDVDYVKVFGVPHRAIDIAVSQGSIVHSIADGVVFAVRDGGATGFSYVLIGHRGGYASLYGQVSKFLVSKGDIVNMGQAIALSGGTPGTHGAGRMTTGAHVHLEVTKNGEHVDPRSILK